MKQLEITILRIQQIIDTINNNNINSENQIAEIIGVSQSVVSSTIRKHINIEKNYIYKIKINNEEIYKSIIKNADEIPYIIKMKKMIEKLKENPSIYFFSNKWLRYFFELNEKEISQFKAYAIDYLEELDIKSKSDE